MGEADLDTKRRIMGQTVFDAQYQQRPFPDYGAVIKRGWLRYYEEPPSDYDGRSMGRTGSSLMPRLLFCLKLRLP